MSADAGAFPRAVSSAWLLGSSAPDLCIPVVGFRQWRISRGRLTSPYTGTTWASAELRASCGAGHHDPADTPAPRCTSGIYALYEPCPRMASAATPDFVSGAVVVWGRIEAHATGMRASHARIVGLELPIARGGKRRRIAEIAERLGVPVLPHGALRKTAALHGLPLPPSLRTSCPFPTRPRTGRLGRRRGGRFDRAGLIGSV